MSTKTDTKTGTEETMAATETDKISSAGWTRHYFAHGGPSGFETNGTVFRCIACRKAGRVFEMNGSGPGMHGHTKNIHYSPRKAKTVKSTPQKTAAKAPAKKAAPVKVAKRLPRSPISALSDISDAIDTVAVQVNDLIKRAETAEAERDEALSRLAKVQEAMG